MVKRNSPRAVKDGREIGSILSAEEKKLLVKEKMKAAKEKDIPKTAQQSIPYQEMYKDGICKINDHLFSKCVQFGDTNYQLAQNDDKTAIFEYWCDFYNYFDSSISVQISCMSQYANVSDMASSLEIPHQQDDFNDIRD